MPLRGREKAETVSLSSSSARLLLTYAPLSLVWSASDVSISVCQRL